MRKTANPPLVKKSGIGHVDLRVKDMGAGLPFYKALLPALGFAPTSEDDIWMVFTAEGEFPAAPFVGLTGDPSHRPNENRIAFWVSSPAEVDRIGDLLRRLGAEIESGPRPCPEYTPSYYAVFFRDPSGNRLEVAFRSD